MLVLERILTVDPVMESAGRRLMLTFDALGHPELAEREFQRLKQALADVKRRPSLATRQLRSDIQRRHRRP